MTGTTRAAWLITAQSVLILFGLIALPLITESRQPLGSAGILFVVFFVTLPGVFFWIAWDHQRQQEQLRELRSRVEELERKPPA